MLKISFNFILLTALFVNYSMAFEQAFIKKDDGVVIESIQKVDLLYRESILKKKQMGIGVPILYQDGILFTYGGKENDTVSLSGSFLNWTRKFKMKKKDYGIYEVFIPLELKAGEYTYRFFVNKVWINDPSQSHQVNDRYGTLMSAFYLEKDMVFIKKSPKRIKGRVYKFFLKDQRYQKVSWIGNDNLWDPYVDYMRLEGVYWVIEKHIDSNRTFYKYRVDGKLMLDPNNEYVTEIGFGENVNYIPKGK